MHSLKVLLASQDCAAMGLLCAGISVDMSLHLAGVCRSGADALAAAEEMKPDVVALDLRLAFGNGCALISELRERCGAAIVAMGAAAGEALHALDAGAADFVLIPAGGSDSDSKLFAGDALERIKAASLIGLLDRPGVMNKPKRPVRLLAIACAKGGPAPVACLLRSLPASGPAMLILQRNAEAFSEDFIYELSRMSGREISRGRDGMELEPGGIYFIGGECCARVEKAGGKLLLRLSDSGSISPADALFTSAAEVLGEEAACVLLSGSDGMEGLKRTAVRGGLAIIQNKNALLRELGYQAPGGILELPLEDVADAISLIIEFLPPLLSHRPS